MSKPRFNWWGFAMAMIRDYPDRAKALKDLRTQKTTASFSGMPGGGGAGRTTETIAFRTLPAQEMREYDAVDLAIKRTKTMPDAKLRMDVIKLTMWGKNRIDSASFALHISDRTARRYRWQFILLVGHTYGFLDQEAFRAAMARDNPGKDRTQKAKKMC